MEATTNRVGWLVDRLDEAEQEIERLHDEVADWRTRARAAEGRLGDEEAAKRNSLKVVVYEAGIRQILNNPTMDRADVQGRLMTMLQDQGGM